MLTIIGLGALCALGYFAYNHVKLANVKADLAALKTKLGL